MLAFSSNGWELLVHMPITRSYVLDKQPVRNIPANNARGTKSRVRPAEYNRRQLRLETRSSC